MDYDPKVNENVEFKAHTFTIAGLIRNWLWHLLHLWHPQHLRQYRPAAS